MVQSLPNYWTKTNAFSHAAGFTASYAGSCVIHGPQNDEDVGNSLASETTWIERGFPAVIRPMLFEPTCVRIRSQFIVDGFELIHSK
jgi:hypothetical protein